jgi:hypothetical protein
LFKEPRKAAAKRDHCEAEDGHLDREQRPWKNATPAAICGECLIYGLSLATRSINCKASDRVDIMP